MSTEIDQSPDSEQLMSDAVSAKPVKINERINVMDVLRGFALIGIILMNIEWFNRPIAALGFFDPTLNGFD